MEVSQSDLGAVLAEYNPWWRGESFPDLPEWRRAAFHEMKNWAVAPPAHRAVLVSGPRQIGKTTLMLQLAEALIADGVPPANILYATFDHYLLKLAGIENTLEAWRNREVRIPGPEYILLDEAQFIRNWGTWVKHQVDFNKDRHIILTGSAIPLVEQGQESGVGRWHTIKLSTLSFYEYLRLKKLELRELPSIRSLRQLNGQHPSFFLKIAADAAPYVAHFNEYLVRGGFPQTAQVPTITQAQKLMREDIIDKVLKRDMTALFGVRHILDLEHTFLYLCMHSGMLLNMPDLCKNLEVKRPTAQSFIDLLEATHLIYRLPPHGYGKDVLRGKFKIYLADAAIPSAVMLRGKSMLDDDTAMGHAVETAVFKHLFARYYNFNVRFSYWKGKADHEVDIVAAMESELVPFEIKYRTQHTAPRDLKGLKEFCARGDVSRGYVITKSLQDFGVLDPEQWSGKSVLKIPAPLFCYWLGETEIHRQGDLFET